MIESSPCPCGSLKSYAACCEPYLQGTAQPPTAEALMRSRYTAYVNSNADYLLATHHPSKRRLGDLDKLRQNCQNTTWRGLSILEANAGQPSDETGTVEFVALYGTTTVAQLHEKSRFVKHKGRWLYLEGDLLPPLAPQRSAPCWCGSGKKFKLCHGRG
ncbi:YchJ family protein [Pseudanabaena sp. FACHB-2040]|uniref:YchJ family protein n=1 Tax=Pseudanabaena sp. FACHB-2040 TaxID=2692859 RepID=UPI001689267C|nr:YchJ family protein [Pseudanabaena sp. FACHB-2040]MBD2259405.1 YchJ family protein [Pseudanabaena sp. FACHB-2040]